MENYKETLQTCYAEYKDEEKRKALCIQIFKKKLERHIRLYGNADYNYWLPSPFAQHVICAYLKEQEIEHYFSYRSKLGNKCDRPMSIVIPVTQWQT